MPSDGAPLTAQLSYEGAVPVVVLRGELDIASGDIVREVLDQSELDPEEKVVVDLSRLDFMDSSGIALLLTLAGRVHRLEVRAPSPVVRQVIEMTGLTGTLVIVP